LVSNEKRRREETRGAFGGACEVPFGF
jgi:hypothetical protein